MKPAISGTSATVEPRPEPADSLSAGGTSLAYSVVEGQSQLADIANRDLARHDPRPVDDPAHPEDRYLAVQFQQDARRQATGT